MLVPQTYALTLIVMILSMVLLGSWANTFKMAGKWRFELYYFDFALGLLLMAVLLALTLGSLGFDGFSFADDLSHAGKRQWFYGFVAGVIFNFANMLLMAAISVAGMAVAFPLGIGTAVVISSILGLLVRRTVNPVLLLAGCLLIMAAIATGGFAYNALLVRRHEALARAGKARSTRRPSALKGVVLSLVSGLLMGSFGPLLKNGMEGELGLGPYAIIAVFAVGVFFSTFAFNMFFINLPVEGDPVEIADYFKARPAIHLLGISGGGLWAMGAAAALVASVTPAGAQLSQPLGFALSQGFAVVAALWGLLAWKEFSESDLKIQLSAVLMLVMYVGGLALLAMAPMYVRAG